MKKRGPGIREDARNLTLIGVAAGIGLLGTAAFVAVNVVNSIEHDFQVVISEFDNAQTVTIGAWEPVDVDPAPLLYGDVMTADGDILTGFLRWDQNEGAWADLLDADKRYKGTIIQSGVRFGHLDRIEVAGSNEAVFILKSGEEITMESGSTDIGSGLRSLTVFAADGQRFELNWGNLEGVDFLEAPADAAAPAGRLHGTLTTRSGDAFTGYIAWDVDEVYTTDILDGEIRGDDIEIPFGAIELIERFSSNAADVLLTNGESYRLRGTNDVDDSNRGIAVADPALGQVMVEWDEFRDVRFHAPEAQMDASAFSGGQFLQGTVVTTDGREYTGTIQWDEDEGRSWELLNGDYRGATFQVEFGQIARIQNLGNASRVELRDGRIFELDGSNDVNRSNDGIIITSEDGAAHRVSWSNFDELRMGW